MTTGSKKSTKNTQKKQAKKKTLAKKTSEKKKTPKKKMPKEVVEQLDLFSDLSVEEGEF